MQRLGYLKYLVHLAFSRETSDFETLGKELTRAVTCHVTVPMSPEVVEYIRKRLTDSAYDQLKKKLARNASEQPSSISLEVQDVYLAFPILPSQTGKLVLADWRRYTLLGTQLGFLRQGTYSALVRGVSLLRLCSEPELKAFTAYNPEQNPFVISTPQALLLLYSLIENDGDTIRLLYRHLLARESEAFSDREAGDYLPDVYREIERAERRRNLPIEEREKLGKLLRMADNIEKWRGRSYTGSGALIEAITARLEPYVDLGLLRKPDPVHYEYAFTDRGRAFFSNLVNSQDIADFLQNRFFSVSAPLFRKQARHRKHPPSIAKALYKSWTELKSGLGYAPITELCLFAVSKSVSETGIYFEVAESFAALRSYQKEHPDCVRFTVNRMGKLAHVKFLKEPSDARSKGAGHEGSRDNH